MNSNSPLNRDAGTIVAGCLGGMISGVCFGALLAWWFKDGASAIFVVLVIHAAVAGTAMGGWLLPTICSK